MNTLCTRCFINSDKGLTGIENWLGPWLNMSTTTRCVSEEYFRNWRCTKNFRIGYSNGCVGRRNRAELSQQFLYGEKGVTVSSSAHWPGDLLRLLTMLFVMAVLVNYPWERLQSQLYVDPGGASIPWELCLATSLIDGLFVLMIRSGPIRLNSQESEATW